MTIDPLPQTLAGTCADGILIGAVLTTFKAETAGIWLSLGSAVTGAISWWFMGG